MISKSISDGVAPGSYFVLIAQAREYFAHTSIGWQFEHEHKWGTIGYRNFIQLMAVLLHFPFEILAHNLPYI